MKPFRVQAHRSGQHTVWFTDSEAETLDDAIEKAITLHLDWSRKVRVIDAESGQVLFQRPPSVRRRTSL